MIRPGHLWRGRATGPKSTVESQRIRALHSATSRYFCCACLCFVLAVAWIGITPLDRSWDLSGQVREHSGEYSLSPQDDAFLHDLCARIYRSARGYVAWGGPPPGLELDGTVVPCAAGGSLMFAPDICLPALKAMREKFGGRIWGPYGFVDAFNPGTGWVDPDVIGIDLGITLLSAENLRNEGVWRLFMRNPEIKSAMDLVGLREQPTSK